MDEARLDEAARALAEARRRGTRIRLADPPRDFDEGFAIQDRVVAALGEPVIGWKVIEVPQGPVIHAPILGGGEVPAGGAWRVVGGEPAGFELEIAFRMARDVPADADAEAIVAAIGSAHVVFELCQSRNAAPESLPRHVGLADCILNAGLVVGPRIAAWQSRDLRQVPGRLLVDGSEAATGRSIDPIRAISVLPAALAARGKALQAGAVVITGSLTGMTWLDGRHAVRGEIEGCDAVEITVERA